VVRTNNNNNTGAKGWKANSKDGSLLAKLLKTKKFSAGVAPAAIKEACPQFSRHKNDSFAAGLRRMKTKFGLNVRGNTGESSVDIVFLLHCLCCQSGHVALLSFPRR